MNPVKNFGPGEKWAQPDGTLTERAKGYLRAISDYTGAGSGTLPSGVLGGDGTTTKFYRADGAFVVPSYKVGADPSAAVGVNAVVGVADTYLRSDAAPALDLAITPTWTGAHVFSSSVTTGAFGANGATPQTAASVGAAVVTTAATTSTPYGYATQAQADDIVNRLNAIRAALIANGILV